MYKRVDKGFIRKLEKIVGEDNLILEEERLLDYSHDEFSLKEIARLPEVVVKPRSSLEVSRVLICANEEKVPVTPRGGATGLCGGCVPVWGGIVLSLEKMNRIIEVDRDNQMAVVEAGVTLKNFVSAVEDAGLFFPPHPGEESAMIGGLIATNAGGSRAVKYGVMRNYVRGVEVVLPQGAVLNLGGKLMKGSSGYSLLNLIIGSEGTLGVITRAIIQLLPPPRLTRTLIIPFTDLEEAIETVPLLIKQKILPLAVEFIPLEIIQITEERLMKKWPSSVGETHLLIILDAPTEEEMDRLSQEVAEVCLQKNALDVLVAETQKKQADILEIRSKIYEALKLYTVEVFDIVVPRGEIARHVKRVKEIGQKYGVWLPTFGHAADGNVHTHLMKARFEEGKMIPIEEKVWRNALEGVRKELYLDCKHRGGLVSGEHGIGLVKKPYLSIVLDPQELCLMKGIKKLFDPNNILNPGKIFELKI